MARCGCANAGPAVLQALDSSVQVKGEGSIFSPYFISIPSAAKPGHDPGKADIVTVKGWALSQSFSLISATRNLDGVVTSATIRWPDGTPGTYTADVVNPDYDQADAWHATYGTSIITQLTMTRDASGGVVAQPELVVST